MLSTRSIMWPAACLGLNASTLAARSLVATTARTRRPLLSRPTRVRSESTVTGDEQSGHIAAGPNESILFFDNLFPLRVSSFVRWPFYPSDRDLTDLLRRFQSSSLGAMDPINMVKRAIPAGLPMEVTGIVPRLTDGGAFVKFSYAEGTPPAEIESRLRKLLEQRPLRPWFNPLRGVRAGLVRGVPWLEDLYRPPKGRLRVEFAGDEAAELSQETLYSLFRRYGKIAEITPQPAESKATPRFAHVDFALVRDAIMARNCMHGFVLREGGHATRLRLSYEPRVRAHRVWDWLASHPRIVIPLVAALLATVTVAIFDPIREFFIRAHVQNSFRISNSRLYRWFVRQTSDMLAFHRNKSEAAGLGTLFAHRKDLIDEIGSWLLETTDTFIVVQGPKGSGKKELVLDQALRERDDVLVLDCRPVVEARGEAGTISRLASQVGYRPVFSWAIQLSSLADLAIQGTTGVKTGFSETLESQVVKILQATAAALKQVSLAHRKQDGGPDAALSEDAYLESHPERRAVVVVNNFLHRNEEKSVVHDKIAEWAATLVQANIAHVIFLTSDSSFGKSLSHALPDRVFHQLALGDLSRDVAKTFVLSQLESADADGGKARQRDGESGVREDSSGDKGNKDAKSEAAEQPPRSQRPDLAELDECVEALGGRLTDLQLLARRLKIGQSPSKAVSEIIEQSTSEILRMFLLGKHGGGGGGDGGGGTGDDRKWSAEQAWYLIREIAAQESLRYNEVLLSPTFASSTSRGAVDGEAALESLAAAELITIRAGANGRPQTIRPGRPVYRAAFDRLLGDAGLRAKMDLAVLTELAKVEAAAIDKCEKELAVLGALPGPPPEARDRAAFLLGKLRASQTKIAAFEKEMGGLKAVLAREA